MNNDKRIAAESYKSGIRKWQNTKEMKYQKQKKERPAPRKTYGLVEHLHIRTIVQYLDVQIQGRQNATMVSVCVKGKSSCRRTMCINSNKNNCRYERLNNKINNWTVKYMVTTWIKVEDNCHNSKQATDVKIGIYHMSLNWYPSLVISLVLVIIMCLS